jgi:hypothetical protein
MPTTFVPKQFYYEFGFKDNEFPIVSTWEYVGIVKLNDVSSSSCDVPNHFLRFELVSRNFEERPQKNVPSIALASRIMLTIDELLAHINHHCNRESET